jgi:hypothetical protein
VEILARSATRAACGCLCRARNNRRRGGGARRHRIFGCRTGLGEIRPSCTELRRAWESAPARRVSVHCVVRNGESHDIQPVIDPVVCRNGNTTRIGPLMFRNGYLTRWGVTARGVSLRPVERLRAEKGSRKPPPARDLRNLVRTNAPIAKVQSSWREWRRRTAGMLCRARANAGG